MRPKFLITIIIILILISCSYNSQKKSNVQMVSFGIYQTIKAKELPANLLDTISKLRILPEKDGQLPVIGYILKSDSTFLPFFSIKENFKIISSYYTIDKEGKYFEVVALELKPLISNPDIESVKTVNNNIEIHFNYSGAIKWSKMTNSNIGKNIAFVIDNRIYNLTIVNAEIKNGVAIINGIENETIANFLASCLNSGISK